MSEPMNLVTEKYEFYFYKPRKMVHARAEHVVQVNIATVERRVFTEKEKAELKDFFKDMGKWETFVKAGRSLLEQLGINLQAQKEDARLFGYDKYEVEFKDNDDRIRVRIALTREESLRRTKGDTEYAELPVKEIHDQTDNIQKWHALRKAISELKKHGTQKGN